MTDRLDDLKAAFVFGTRLPVKAPDPFPPLGESLRVFPIVGAAVGLISGALLVVLLALGVPAVPAAVVTVFLEIALTGALHEDGLADFTDGAWGGRDREAKLAIMKDSRVGPYGVLALAFSVLARVTTLGAIAGSAGGAAAAAALVAAASLSRTLPVALLHRLEPARNEGRSIEAGRPSRAAMNEALAWGLGLAALVLLPVAGFWSFLATLLAAPIPYAAVSRTALKHLGGQTGDVAGASQQAGEIAVMLVLSAMMR
ncbi:MAG: adenosylcobinamide-GDP ribazoletransferase [Hyphomicrobiales bacterium]